MRAGDRAPDAPDLVLVANSNRAASSVPGISTLPAKGLGSSRLFDIFAPTYHTVLIFAPALANPVVSSVLSALQQCVPQNGLVRLLSLLVVLPDVSP